MTNEPDTMTETAYREEVTRAEHEHRRQIAALEAGIATNRRETVRANVRASLSATNARPGAVKQIADLVLMRVEYDGAGRAFVEGSAGDRLSPEQAAAQLVLDSPHFQRAADDTGRASGSWDIDKALTDVHYAKKWQAADPKGFEAAWSAHLAEIRKRR